MTKPTTRVMMARAMMTKVTGTRMSTKGGTARSARTSGSLLKREIFISICAQRNDILCYPQHI